MADALTTVTNLINSPPGQLVAGGVLAGIVWKFFERVEAVLTDQTKFEIAVWLVGVKVGQKVEPWPDTFAKMFDRVFDCDTQFVRFSRSAISSLISLSVSVALALTLYGPQIFVPLFGPVSALPRVFVVLSVVVGSNAVIGHCVSILVQILLGVRSRSDSGFFMEVAATMVPFVILVIVTAIWGGRSLLASDLFRRSAGNMLAGFHNPLTVLWYFPSFFAVAWLWLYAWAGFLLKAARRFDKSLGWFNRRFDIKKKPLQSIGLVAGALVAMVYWAAVVVSRIVG